MGLDIHRDTIVACLLVGDPDHEPRTETRTFGTLIPEMANLCAWVTESDCHYVAMESTGVYWQPIYERLECCFNGNIHLSVVNARHMKNVPGKKTDIRDSEWIATLLRAGLLKGSFIPDKPFRELRQLTRYRKNITRDVTSQKNRIDKFLHTAGFRLSMFLSDIFGASGRAIIRHLSQHGTISMSDLDRCLKTKTRNKINDIMVSVNGTLSIHEQQCLAMMLSHLELIEMHKCEIEKAIEAEIMQHTRAMELLCSIPGINVTAASAILAEIGTDMSRFPTAEHLCSWAGLAPGNNESAGKRKRANVNKGNPFLKSMLCEIGWVVTSHRGMYLSGWYWRVKQRIGAKRAIVALARKLLVLIYTLFKTDQPYNEERFEQRKLASQQKRACRMIGELVKLGYRVERPA